MTRNPERNLWCAVMIAVLDDYNNAYCRAVKKGISTEPVLADVRRYFTSLDGRINASRAGMDIGPEQAVSAIAKPRRDFKARMLLEPKSYRERDAA